MMLEQHNLKISSIENDIDTVYDELTRAYKFETVRKKCEVGGLNKEYANINVYFLNLYRILRFIHNNNILNINNEYSGLLRSFLSRKLLVILAFHLCYRDKSYNEFIKYINEFGFLEHIDLIYLESLMLSKTMNNISQEIIYQNILELDSLDECKLNCLISSLDNSGGRVVIMNDVSRNLVRSPSLLECYRTILNVKRLNEQLDVTSLNSEFNSDFFFSSLFLAIIKRFDKRAFTGNKHIEQILLYYKRYLK
ncbi:hypothetical protein DDU33_00315 [Actinobacillus porcitonsillarum]|uniref:Uncharacterized protein n=2 Tax=Actinobacillus porcitonsillarum TaxID=189834 RepID=A0A2U8FLX4_9PAST|nr:hypothetical protein DDU33_00315 [Actinobacillus porcitonsillarum]